MSGEIGSFFDFFIKTAARPERFDASECSLAYADNLIKCTYRGKTAAIAFQGEFEGPRDVRFRRMKWALLKQFGIRNEE